MPLIERSSGILRILAYYLTFAIVWILVSDRLLQWTFKDAALLTELQSYKGILFVIFTTAFLGLILTREHHRTLRASALATENEQRVKHLIDTSLARAEDHLQAADLGAPPAPFDWDIASGALVLGDEARSVLSLDATEPYLTLDDWLSRVYEDDRAYVKKSLEAFLGGDALELSLRYRHQSSKGEFLWIQTYGRLVRHPDGTPWRVLGTHCEITHVKQLETELSQQTATLRLFIDHAPAAVAMFDREMRYLSASQRFIDDFDLTSDILGKSHYEVFPHLPLAWRDEHQRAMAGEVVRSSDNHAPDLHGKERWFNREMRPWHDPEGNIGGIVVFIDEITERKRLLDHLTLYSSVFLQAQEAITITDQNARILDVNDAFTRVTGYSREEVLGENPRILQSGEQDQAFYERM